MKYIPSIAFSICDPDADADFEPLRKYVHKWVKKVLEEGLPKGTCLNINFPKAQEFAGEHFCRMTMGRWLNEVEKRRHPRGYDYFWMVGEYHNDEPEAKDSDQWALNHNYVAITPTTMDVTDYEMLRKLKTENNP